MGLYLILVLLAPAALGLRPCAGAASFPRPTYELVAPGVAITRVESPRQKLVFHVVKADLRTRNLRLGAIKAEGKETLAEIAQRLLEQKSPLLVAINGDYFERNTDNGLPWGAHVENGEVYFSPTGKSVFCVDPQGRPFIDVITLKLGVRFGAGSAVQRVQVVNRPRNRGDDSLYLYTPVWGAGAPVPSGGIGVAVAGAAPRLGSIVKGKVSELSMGGADVPIPPGGVLLASSSRGSRALRRLKIGTGVSLKAELSRNAVSAVGGGPRLVRAGKVVVEFQKENFAGSHSNYLSGSHPRSAIGYSRARDVLILLVVEGRTEASKGVTMGGLAQLLIAHGAWDGMAFDGGGSATLYVAGNLVVHGGGKVEERRLGNALGIFFERKPAR